ncbi:MAG TPA: 5-formyltetrahydrofolate cyclo-ligase [Candidatus Saccharimonadales bacterium]|jgi:5-formyltetrahydrofolate cyclo-ligase|nr:5-formyltetrahydrofolate cyclo-ligase [Candidatus Saccharimonadales bacterium]
MESKEELRERLKRARLELTDAEHTVKSREIVKKLKLAMDWSRIKTLHYFEPMLDLLEPDIAEFINYLEDNFRDLKLFTPRKIEGTWQLIAVNGRGAPDGFDAVIVPMLGFDLKTLHRIGYGGGYYDRFLANLPEARKIGACFELGKLDHIPAEPHDIPLDAIITETATYPS